MLVALASIESNETVTLSYKLKLKSTIDRSLLDRLLKTNRQIVVTEWGSVIEFVHALVQCLQLHL